MSECKTCGHSCHCGDICQNGNGCGCGYCVHLNKGETMVNWIKKQWQKFVDWVFKDFYKD
jgi:hypothetical protein